jgi:hypothetical protein
MWNFNGKRFFQAKILQLALTKLSQWYHHAHIGQQLETLFSILSIIAVLYSYKKKKKKKSYQSIIAVLYDLKKQDNQHFLQETC